METKYYRNWHLAKDETELKITEMEYALLRFYEAFARWITTMGEMTGASDLKPTEHVILHVVRMQNRPKSSATIARLINRDDIPNIQYSLRKLEAAGLIEKSRESGTKTITYTITPIGEERTNEYSKLRSELLVRNLKDITSLDGRLEDATRLLSVMTGIYEETARNSASYNRDNTA